MKRKAPYFAVCLISFWLFAALLVYSKPVTAEMTMLSKIQSGIFHVSPAPFTSETDKTDRYIDDEQAEFFIAAARAEPYLPADGNYPFSVVDHNILDSDLVIDLDPESIVLPETDTLYLSRHNISKWDYTDREKPDFEMKPNIHAPEPFTNQEVEGVAWESDEVGLDQNEIFTKYGFMSGAESTTSGGVSAYHSPPPLLPTLLEENGSKTNHNDADNSP
ncbi:MAG: hypothetical protein ACQERN_07145 [Thermodesulfobacteriota bacterium]